MSFRIASILALACSFALALPFGWLGICGMTDCLGSGRLTVGSVVTGSAGLIVASVPLVASIYVIRLAHTGRSLSKMRARVLWAVAVSLGALGLFQIVLDPGDARWSGLPLVGLSIFLGLSIRVFPKSRI